MFALQLLFCIRNWGIINFIIWSSGFRAFRRHCDWTRKRHILHHLGLCTFLLGKNWLSPIKALIHFVNQSMSNLLLLLHEISSMSYSLCFNVVYTKPRILVVIYLALSVSNLPFNVWKGAGEETVLQAFTLCQRRHQKILEGRRTEEGISLLILLMSSQYKHFALAAILA